MSYNPYEDPRQNPDPDPETAAHAAALRDFEARASLDAAPNYDAVPTYGGVTSSMPRGSQTGYREALRALQAPLTSEQRTAPFVPDVPQRIHPIVLLLIGALVVVVIITGIRTTESPAPESTVPSPPPVALPTHVSIDCLDVSPRASCGPVTSTGSPDHPALSLTVNGVDAGMLAYYCSIGYHDMFTQNGKPVGESHCVQVLGYTPDRYSAPIAEMVYLQEPGVWRFGWQLIGPNGQVVVEAEYGVTVTK